MSAVRRLAPSEFARAVSAAQERKLRKHYGRETDFARSSRTIRDADLHKLFRVGREVVFLNADGSPRVDEAGRPKLHRITAAESMRAIVLVGMVKKIVGLEPQKRLKDTEILKRLRQDLGEESWSLSTVRRTRRLCEAAGLYVRTLRSDGLGEGIAEPDWKGALWVLDRSRLALVENCELESDLNRPLVTDDQTPPIRAREKPFSLRSNGSENGRARAGPFKRAASVAVREALGELRAWEREQRRGRRQGRPTPQTATDQIPQPVLKLVAALTAERWKVRSEWGEAAAIQQGADRAVALGVPPELAAAAQQLLLRKFVGEQLSLQQRGEKAEP